MSWLFRGAWVECYGDRLMIRIAGVIRLFLADDHVMFIEGLEAHFSRVPGIKVVGRASTTDDAERLFAELTFDVAVLDMKIPPAGGLKLLPVLRKLKPKARALVLSMYDHPLYVREAFECGTHGYVLKGGAFKELEQAIVSVADGKTYLSPDIAHVLGNEKAISSDDAPVQALSEREFEVLRCLVEGLMLKEIAARLEVSENTIGTYRARIMKKWGVESRAELLQVAIQSGILQ